MELSTARALVMGAGLGFLYASYIMNPPTPMSMRKTASTSAPGLRHLREHPRQSLGPRLLVHGAYLFLDGHYFFLPT